MRYRPSSLLQLLLLISTLLSLAACQDKFPCGVMRDGEVTRCDKDGESCVCATNRCAVDDSREGCEARHGRKECRGWDDRGTEDHPDALACKSGKRYAYGGRECVLLDEKLGINVEPDDTPGLCPGVAFDECGLVGGTPCPADQVCFCDVHMCGIPGNRVDLCAEDEFYTPGYSPCDPPHPGAEVDENGCDPQDSALRCPDRIGECRDVSCTPSQVLSYADGDPGLCDNAYPGEPPPANDSGTETETGNGTEETGSEETESGTDDTETGGP